MAGGVGVAKLVVVSLIWWWSTIMVGGGGGGRSILRVSVGGKYVRRFVYQEDRPT